MVSLVSYHFEWVDCFRSFVFILISNIWWTVVFSCTKLKWDRVTHTHTQSFVFFSRNFIVQKPVRSSNQKIIFVLPQNTHNWVFGWHFFFLEFNLDCINGKLCMISSNEYLYLRVYSFLFTIKILIKWFNKTDRNNSLTHTEYL